MFSDMTWPYTPSLGELAGRTCVDNRTYRAALAAARERRCATIDVLHGLLHLLDVTAKHGDVEGHADRLRAQVIDIMVALASNLGGQR